MAMGVGLLGLARVTLVSLRVGTGKGRQNLMMVIDEAKTVPDSIFEAVERCQLVDFDDEFSWWDSGAFYWRLLRRHICGRPSV